MALMSADFQSLVNDFQRHLESERNLSVHTVRAYVGDLQSLINHLETMGKSDIATLDMAQIRSWLANQQVKGGARTTMSRRAVSIRLFTKWAFKHNYLSSDVGANLATPKAHRTLPEVLDAASTGIAMDALAARVDEGEGPLALRDRAMVEVLYASGARVAELCGLDLQDIDYERQTIRVFGKGSKERTIPIGNPAMRALKAWLADGRPLLMKEESEKLGLTEANIQKMGRTKLVRVRIRAGKVQRKKKFSTVPGYTIRGGRLVRMSSQERRHRKMGARRAKVKLRSKRNTILRKRKISLRKRKAMGIR